MRIDLAFCVELGQVVDIHLACQKFADQDQLSKFNFLCSDPICRESKNGGVRIVGVNHNKSPEEQAISNSPHFRVLDKHDPNCNWVELEAALFEDEQLTELQEPSKNRKKHPLVKRIITRFIIPDFSNDENQDSVANELALIRSDTNSVSRREKLLAYARGAGATATSLEALVSCYEELKAENALNEKFTVPNHGSTSFRSAFRQLTLGTTTEDCFAVFHG